MWPGRKLVTVSGSPHMQSCMRKACNPRAVRQLLTQHDQLPPARARAGAAPVFRLSAHDKPTCAMSFCPSVPGLLATAATDKRTKLWDVSSGAPVLLASQDLQVRLFVPFGGLWEAAGVRAGGGATRLPLLPPGDRRVLHGQGARTHTPVRQNGGVTRCVCAWRGVAGVRLCVRMVRCGYVAWLVEEFGGDGGAGRTGEGNDGWRSWENRRGE